jgi:chromate transporter
MVDLFKSASANLARSAAIMTSGDTEKTIADENAARSSALEVFFTFLRLGVTSFGGPVAHIGYFHREFVVRSRWADEGTFADLVGLSQFLPGPSSSQVALAIGLSRRGLLGGLAAWLGFTLPSAILLYAFAQLAASLSGPVAMAGLQGLKITAVAIVAQAVWGMARMLTPDLRRGVIAVAAAGIEFLIAGSFGQITAIVLGGVAGIALCRNIPSSAKGHIAFSVSRRGGLICLVAFFVILFGAPILATMLGNHTIAVFNAFYRSGALVFGGGHVVLPLLRDAVVTPGWISTNSFLSGYGAAQAIPGPLFTFAAYLGASLNAPPNGAVGAFIGLIAIFLPGTLILIGALPFWDQFRSRTNAQALMRGVNAAVVGILAAALYDPLWKTSILVPWHAALAIVGFLLLTLVKLPSWAVVALIVAAAIGLSL